MSSEKKTVPAKGYKTLPITLTHGPVPAEVKGCGNGCPGCTCSADRDKVKMPEFQYQEPGPSKLSESPL